MQPIVSKRASRTPCQNDKKITDLMVKNFKTGSNGLSSSRVAKQNRNSAQRANEIDTLQISVTQRQPQSEKNILCIEYFTNFELTNFLGVSIFQPNKVFLDSCILHNVQPGRLSLICCCQPIFYSMLLSVVLTEIVQVFTIQPNQAEQSTDYV